MKILCATDIMEQNVISLSPQTSLKEAWEMFSCNRISGAPVVSDKEGLVGVLSQSDILYYVTTQEDEDRPQNSYYIGDPFWDAESFDTAIDQLAQSCVEDLMSSSVVSVAPDDPISTVAVVMRTNHIHRVIVTDENKVVGIITALDLLSVLEQH